MQAWRRRLLGIDAVPADLSEAEIRHFFTLEEEQATIVAHRRRDMNRFGLAIQIGFLRLAGRPLDPMRLIPPAVLACVAEQTGVAAPMIATLRAIYRRRRRTLFEHQQAAMQALGFRPCTPAAERALTAYLRKEARTVMDRGELVTQARAWLYDHGYLAPGKRRLDDLASAAQNFVFTALQSAIVDRVGKEAAASWARELTGPGRMTGETRLDWLRRPAGGTSVRDISDVQARLDELRRLGAERLDLPALPIERMRTHARRIALRKASTLNRLREPRRTVEIGCWLRLHLITLTDTVLEQTNRHVGDLWGRARQRVEHRALNELQRYRFGMDAVCAALADLDLPPEAFRSAVAEAAAPFAGAPPRDSKAHAIRTEMAGEPGRLRALMRRVTGLDLSIGEQHPLRIALSTLETAYRTGDPRIPAAAVQALPRAARRPVERAPSPSDRLSAFEVAAALLLKRSLRNGQASAPHSLKHRAVADQLMPRSMWAEQRGRILRANGWPSSLDAYLRRFERPLALRLEMLDEAVEAGEIGIERDRFKVPRYRPDPVDPEVDRTRDALFAAIGEVQLPDILVATDVRARFSWLALGRQPANERELLSHYAGLLALGTEKTAAAMARMVDGVSTDQIELAMRQIEEAGQLRAASDAVVADLLAQPIASLWGSGVLASADMMSLDATRHLWTARIEPRRRIPAVGTYTHVLDQWAIVYDQPIVLNRRQAGAAIEGVLQQEVAQLQRLAVDSHGFTHFAMAVAKLLGFDLCPRLTDVGGRKLYLPKGIPVPDRLEPMVERVTVGRAARSGWDDLLKLVASLKAGYGSASTIIDRHGSAARGMPVYECGTVLGKILRTLFLLDYLVNPGFQHEVHRSLNQGESVHPLQRALMAGRIEAKHGRTSQEMTAISGALTLLTNAVMAWNAEQMQRIVTEGGPALYPDAHLARIAPVAYKHINMNGVMRFRIEESHNLVRQRARRA